MEEDVLYEFVEKFMFTKSTDLMNVHRICFERCFRQTGREEGFRKALSKIIESKDNPEIRYTIKSFEVIDSSLCDTETVEKLFSAVLFNR